MAWTYGGAPGTSDVDAVRFHSGQLSSADTFLVHDEEIQYLLDQEGDVYGAAACIAENLAQRYSGKATSKTVGETTLSFATRATEFRNTATSLRNRAAIRGVTPYAGGISRAGKEAVEADSDRVVPAFAIGMDDVNGTATAGSSS